MKNVVLLFVFGMISYTTFGQATTPAPVKIGYVDVDYIFSQMPDSKVIDAELKSTQTQLKNTIDSKVADFQKKLADYQANPNMLPAVKANTERELQQLQSNIEQLQQDAQSSLQTKQNTLMAPVFAKVGDAIEATAKENGFTFVLSQQIGGLDVILYGDEKLDISDLVLKKLGVTPQPATTGGATTTKKQ